MHLHRNYNQGSEPIQRTETKIENEFFFDWNRSGVVPKSDSLPEFDSPRVNAHDVILCRQLRKQTDIRRRK